LVNVVQVKGPALGGPEVFANDRKDPWWSGKDTGKYEDFAKKTKNGESKARKVQN